MIDSLSDDVFFSYAMNHYSNLHCIDVDEFTEDLNRIKYIKRLFNRYEKGGELKERHIINHLIILYNVFPFQACTAMLLHKLEDYLPYLKPFLLYLGYWDNDEKIILNNKLTILSSVALDQGIVDKIREMENERRAG